MTCDCGNQNAYRARYKAGVGWVCTRCSSLRSVQNPDVFFKGPYLDTNLIDVKKPEQRNGVWIESRGQKADIMKQLGVMEAGDKRHGCRYQDRQAIRREQERMR